jgi:hypothetical protein
MQAAAARLVQPAPAQMEESRPEIAGAAAAAAALVVAA